MEIPLLRKQQTFWFLDWENLEIYVGVKIYVQRKDIAFISSFKPCTIKLNGSVITAKIHKGIKFGSQKALICYFLNSLAHRKFP